MKCVIVIIRVRDEMQKQQMPIVNRCSKINNNQEEKEMKIPKINK